MNVSSLTGTTAPRPMSPPPGPPSAGGPAKTLQAVADRLGLDPEALKKALDGGSTMSSLAAESGISQEDLIATIAATLPAQGPDGVATDVDLAQGIQALSSALGISGPDLLDRLTNGTGISDLLAQNPDVSAQLAANQNRGALVDGYT